LTAAGDPKSSAGPSGEEVRMFGHNTRLWLVIAPFHSLLLLVKT